jgi:hypothetical protein
MQTKLTPEFTFAGFTWPRYVANMVCGTNIIKGGQIIRRSKNLRAIVDYARVSAVARIESAPIRETCGTVRFIFKDGAESRANFASYHIMIDWIRNRQKRSSGFGFAVHIMQGPDVGYLTKPGIIDRRGATSD